MKNRMKWFVLSALFFGALMVVDVFSVELVAVKAGSPDGVPSAEAVSEDIGSLAPAAFPGEAPMTHLEVVTQQFPFSIDPVNANFAGNGLYANLVFQNLFRLCYDTSKPVAELAAEWEFVCASTLDITIQRGITFHDGWSLTAHDVAFSLNRLAQQEWEDFITDMVDHAVAHDEYNLTIYLHFPFAPILHHLAHPMFGIIPMNYFQEVGPEYFEQRPIGSGAFKVESFVSDGDLLGIHLLLSRFEDYSGRLPIVESINVRRAFWDYPTMLQEVSAGTADIAIGVPQSDIQEAVMDSSFNILSVPAFAFDFIWFNTTQPYLDNPLVRKAIAYALDTEAIFEYVFANTGRVTCTALPEGVFGFAEMPPFTTNLDHARELLIEAGHYPQGFETVMWYNTYNLQRQQVAEIMRETLAELNITVHVEGLDFGDYLVYSGLGRHHMLTVSWGAITGDADTGLFTLFHSSNFGNANRGFFYNPELEYLLEAGRTELDPEARQEIYASALRIIRDEAPVIVLRQNEFIVAAGPHIGEFALSPRGFHNLAVIGLTDW